MMDVLSKVKQALIRFTSMLGAENGGGNTKQVNNNNYNNNQSHGIDTGRQVSAATVTAGAVEPPRSGESARGVKEEEEDKDVDDDVGSISTASTSSTVIRARRRTQVLALVPVYLLQVCYGMNSGYPAILTPQLQENCTDTEFPITSSQAAWIVSLENFATPFVCILSGFIQQTYGPKKVLLLACLPYFVAWLFAAFAQGVTFLYISRLLVGVSHGLITTTVYTVEVASKDMRGTYSLWESVLRCLGCLIVYSLGFAIRWDRIAILSPLVPLLAFASCLFVPESPVFLLRQDRPDQAREALTRLYGPKYRVEEEMDIIQANLAELKSKRCKSSSDFKNIWARPEIYKPFLIVLVLSVIQQFSGMSILRAYVVTIFDGVFHPEGGEEGESGGVVPEGECKTSNEGYLSAILLAVVRLASSLLLSRLLVTYRRRSLYMFSIVFTALSLSGFATSTFLISAGIAEDVMKWTSLAMACLLVFSVQLGVQTLPNLLSGELFSADVRAMCKGLTRCFTCVLLVTSLMMYPVMVEHLQLHGTFMVFSLALLPFIPVVYCILPETKDLGLEMIQQYFLPVRTVFYVDLDEDEKDKDKVAPVSNGAAAAVVPEGL